MKFRKFTTCVIVSGFAALFSTSQAQDMSFSGFMTDYTQLEKVTDGSADYRYISPGAEDRLAQYNAIMIDQPEIFIAADSPYKGAKPKYLESLAESLRAGIAGGVAEDYDVVEQPGQNVMYLSIAATNLKLTKKKKKLRNFTPVGLVTGAIKGVASSNIANKADLQGLVFEAELFDSVTEERLVAIIDTLGPDARTQNPATWKELEAFMAAYGKQVKCRLDNARLRVEHRVNCLARE